MKRISKRALAFLLAVVMTVCAAPFAGLVADAATYNGTCGSNLFWSLDTETGVLNISGDGAMEDYSVFYLPWYSLRSNIKSVTVSDGLTVLCDYAFYDCANLTSVSLPASVTDIGYMAFCNCPSLTSISVDSGNQNYSSDEYGVLFNKDKTELIQYPVYRSETSYEIPDGVTAIGGGAFAYCLNLTSIAVPESLTRIGENAFFRCENLSGITLPDGLETVGEKAFYSSGIINAEIPASVISIGSNAFGWCYMLESISVDSANQNYSSDEYGVLFNKDKTELIKFPDNRRQTAYAVPNGVSVIESDAFENCCGLQSVTIPESVTDIGSGAFFNAYLKSISVDSENQNYSSDEYGVLFNKDKTELIQYPARNPKTSYKIPDGVLTVKESAFHNCQTVESIVISDSVTAIENEAFYYCGNLEFIHLTDSVTSVAEAVISNKNTYFCSDSEVCYAKEYADANGITFKVCGGHAATGISLSETELEITNGQTYQLEAAVAPENAADKSVKWSSDNAEVASVDENGVVSAVSVGTANITAATADGGFTASCKVTVNPRYFEVVWIADGAETTQSVAEGAALTAPADPVETGYTFVCWSPEVPEAMPAENMTFTAKWAVNSYGAVFDANGGVWNDGSTEKTLLITYGSDIYTPRDPEKQGYDFAGWTPEIGIMDDVGGKEFSAVWAASTDTKYTVETYTMATDGTYAVDSQTLTGTTDTSVNAEYTVEKGFELNTEKSVLSGTVAPDGSLVLKVYYDRIKIEAVINGEAVDCLYGEEIDEPEKPAAPEGYVQQGWVDENGAAVEFPLIAGESLPAEINPNFVKQSYTVTWTAEGVTTEEIYEFEETINAPADPVKTGYTFAGWTPKVPSQMPAEALAFTATWTANSYDAVFDANGGTWADGSATMTVSTVFDTEIAVPESPVRQGYVFAGWTPEIGVMDDVNGKTYTAGWIAADDTRYTVETYTMAADGTYAVDSQAFAGTTDSTVNAEYTVAQGFELNTEKSVLSGTVAADNSLVLKVYIDRQAYNLTTVVDGVSTSVEYLYGATVTKPANPSKAGYNFIGWDNEFPAAMPAENLAFTAKFEKIIYTCPDCGDRYDDEAAYNEHVAYEQAKKNIRVSIKNNPGSATIKYGETLRLTAVTSAKLPKDTKIYWYVDGAHEGEGEVFNVSFDNGTKTLTVKIVDGSGNALKDAGGNEISASEEVTVKGGFFWKIISFFKNLFRMNRTITQMIIY